MPTVLRVSPYRFFFFYSNEGNETSHVHVEAGEHLAKFWLDPVQCAHTGGFSAKAVSAIARIVEQHRQELLEAWIVYFHP